MAVAETNDQLMARWRELLGAVRGYDRQALDPVDRQTLNELRRQLSAVEEEIDRRKLRRETQRADGTWEPLPLFEPQATERPEPIELSWEKQQEPQPDWELLELADGLEWRLSADELGRERFSASLLEEFSRESDRILPRFDQLEPIRRSRIGPYVPDIDDGLTPMQRVIIEALAECGPMTEQAVVEAGAQVPKDALNEALQQLRLPRPFPLLHEQNERLALTAAAREMVTIDDGRRRVGTGFFPNLLVNGCAEAVAFPTYSLDGVIKAVRLLASDGQFSDHIVASHLGWPTVGPLRSKRRGWSLSGWTDLMTTGVEVLPVVTPPRRIGPSYELLDFRFDDPEAATRALGRSQLAQARGEFVDGVSFEIDASTRLVVRLPRGTRGLAVVRRLLRDTALETMWTVEHRVMDRGASRLAGARELLNHFLLSCRRRAAERLKLTISPARARREILVGLLRAAEEPRLSQLLDATNSKTEAVTLLTGLGSAEVTSRFGFTQSMEPFSTEQAKAIVQTKGLHKNRQFFQLELESVEAEVAQETPLGHKRIDQLVMAELERVAKVVGPPAIS